MTSLRFPLALGVALAFGAAAAHAQSAPAAASATAPTPQTKILDIEVAQEGDSVSILVKLSAQPSAASAVASKDQLKLEIDGVNLVALSLSPPPGSLFATVTAARGEIVVGGVALMAPDVVIYRHAVLVKARLAEPADINGASLMTGATPSPAAPPVEGSAKQAPIALPVAAASPVVPAIVELPISPEPRPAPEHSPIQHIADDDLQSATTAAVHVVGRAASLAGLDPARCKSAAAELAQDSWALGAMGDVALCLIDEGKPEEARARIEQLGAITPQDWRVSLGRALLASDAGDAATANELFLTASLGAPNDALRAEIVTRIKPSATATAGPDIMTEPDLQIPLPK